MSYKLQLAPRPKPEADEEDETSPARKGGHMGRGNDVRGDIKNPTQLQDAYRKRKATQTVIAYNDKMRLEGARVQAAEWDLPQP